MFGKRRRAASNPPQRAPPAVSASASLAATKAFIRDRESNGDLSSAAAAAALRTHVTTPTPVGDTVTKRMVRRGSQSSNGSSARPGMGLRRQSSSGSMTERSFRAPSPGRADSNDFHPPPVPPMPQHIQQGNGVHRRASSLEPLYRGGSPTPRGSGRGVSLDRGASQTSRAQRPSSHLAQVSEEEDAAARSSVNFSRPMSPGLPPAKQNPSPPNSHGWFSGPVINEEAVQRMASTSRPQTSSGVSSYDTRQAQYSVQSAADRPVKTHQISHGVQGARLSSGSMRARPSGTAVPSGPVDPKSPNAIYDPSTRTFIHKQAAMARHRELHEEPEPTQQFVAQHVEEYRPHRIATPPRQHSPSPVRQPESRETLSGPQRVASPLARPASVAYDGEPKSQHMATPRPQSSGLLQRRRSEDFADADIQIPEQANTGRKLEAGSANEREALENLDSPKLKSNQDSAYPYLSAPAGNKAESNRESGSVSEAPDRNTSLSPPRSAHFAPVAVELTGAKHEPLPRSSSPAKSALKSSPSVSRRSHSPVAPNGRPLSMSASSEASDATSNEGTRRKKRNMRVSFEDNPTIAGTAAASSAEKPAVPQGLNASRWSPITEKDNEFEDFMKPRPALPSFGSIRDRERRSAHEDIPEKVTETVSSTPMSASISSIGDQTHASSDHAIGNIVAQDFAKKPRDNDPLPPEVTSVEGSGYVSDSSDESAFRKHGHDTEKWQSSAGPEPKSLSSQIDDKTTSSAPIVERTIEVPGISLFPATPSPTEKPEPQFQSMSVPGGWGDEARKSTRSKDANQQDAPNVTTNDSTAETTRKQQSEPQAATEEDGDTTEDDSIYSDAYEDLSDVEGGFGSIDALMESPVASSRSGLLSSKYADQSTETPASKLKINTQVDDETDEETTPTQDWNATKQHWSGVNTSRKKASHDDAAADRAKDAPITAEKRPMAREASPVSQRQSTVEPVQHANTPFQSTPKPLKSALKKPSTPQPAPAPEPQMRTSMRGPPPSQGSAPEPAHMRKTMRGGPTGATRPESGMRSSMRGGQEPVPRAQPQMRKSMRGTDTTTSSAVGLAASRHSVGPVDAKPPRGALQKRHIPTAGMTSYSRPQSMPAAKQAAPVPTYDSDSDASASSFQRTRARGSRNQGGRYTMRGSMRQEAAPTMRTTAPGPKQVRSISPPEPPAATLRKSMRPSSPTPEVVKSSRFSIRSLSPMGRFRNKMPDVRPSSPTPAPKQSSALSKQPKSQKQKAPVTERAKAPFKSRFGDSSDDDDDQPRRFQSRFADSDSDEALDYKLPPGLAPVRGIPRREDDDDSTDLEEEAEEKPKTTAPLASNEAQKDQVNGKTNAQGAMLASGSLRDSKHAPALPSLERGNKTKTKRGFFGLGKKKVVPTQATTVGPVATHQDIPLPPTQRSRDANAALTPIDEDKDFGTPTASPVSKKSPKLQRRSTPEWPLPPPPMLGSEDRPMSSDGIAPRRPRFQKRHSSQLSNVTAVTAPVVDASGRSVSYGRTGKKKKFQGLRRVFGLND